MYDQSKLSELIRFARVNAGSTVIDVYPGDGDWTRLFSEIVGPEGRVDSFVPAEVAHFKNDPVGLMRTLAKEPGRENVEAVSAEAIGGGARFAETEADTAVAAGPTRVARKTRFFSGGCWHDAEVFLRADRALEYGRVAQVMGELDRAGLKKVALVMLGGDEGN